MGVNMNESKDFICLRDNSIHQSLEHLHAHLRKLKITQAAYYLYYYPRQDLLTGAKIEFKNYNQYFSTYFVNKNNMKKYCLNDPVKGMEFGINYLKERAIRKGIKKAFHQVELKSLPCPTIKFFQQFGDYNKICKELGLTAQFDYSGIINWQFNKFSSALVNYDSREQTPIKFLTVASQLETLKYGDYSINKPYDSGIYVERKGLSDFVSSFGKDYQRLRRELQRCKDAGHYMVVLVLSPFSKALGFNYQFETRYAKVSPDYVFGNVREIIKDFDNVQFLFIDKNRAEEIILKIFQMGKFVKNFDLQYCLDTKKL